LPLGAGSSRAGHFGFWIGDFGLKATQVATFSNPKSEIRNPKWAQPTSLSIGINRGGVVSSGG
jgi:hypothetical protein